MIQATVLIWAGGTFSVPVPLSLSQQWKFSYCRTGCPLRNYTWKPFVSSASCFIVSPLIFSFFVLFFIAKQWGKIVHCKKSWLKQHTFTILVVSTTMMTKQLSKLMSPLHPPPCLSWRKEFLTFWYCCFCCHGPWKLHGADVLTVFRITCPPSLTTVKHQTAKFPL